MSHSARYSPSRFYAVVLLASGVLAAATVVLARQGEAQELRPIAVSPPLDEPLSTRPEWRLRFRQPLDASTAPGRVRLDPPVPLSVDVRGDRLDVRAEVVLAGSAPYTLILGPGLRAAGGRTVHQEQQFRYQTRAPRLLLLRPADGTAARPAQLWSVDLNGGTPRQLTAAEGGVLHATVSPDGSALAYTAPRERESADRADLWLVGRGGETPRRLGPDGGPSAYSLAWSPRGDLIAYERRALAPGLVPGGSRPGTPRLWGITPDGTDVGPLYRGSDDDGQAPSWSPDGGRLAFYQPARRALAVGNFTRELIAIPLSLPGSASWAPDGRSFAYVDFAAPDDLRHTVVRLASGDGEVLRTLTPPGASDNHPAWAPDGGRLAVAREDESGAAGIWLLDVDSNAARALQAEPGWQYGRPLWGPDGQHLYWSRLPLGRRDARWELWAADLSAGSALRLSGDGQVVGWLP